MMSHEKFCCINVFMEKARTLKQFPSGSQMTEEENNFTSTENLWGES